MKDNPQKILVEERGNFSWMMKKEVSFQRGREKFFCFWGGGGAGKKWFRKCYLSWRGRFGGRSGGGTWNECRREYLSVLKLNYLLLKSLYETLSPMSSLTGLILQFFSIVKLGELKFTVSHTVLYCFFVYFFNA